VEVDELEIDAYPTDATINGLGWLAAVRNGALDGAQVRLERLFFAVRQIGTLGMSGGIILGGTP
jgi:hypothetical protein